MISRTSRLPDDTFLMVGTVEQVRLDFVKHRVFTFTREQLDLDRLYGWRCEWAIVFGEYDQEWFDTVLKPMLVVANLHEIHAAQRGEPLKTRPTIWHVPSHSSPINPL